MKRINFKTKDISVVSIMSAIAALLMVIDIPLTFIAPSFYKLDLSDLPCLICSFSLGTLPGIICELLKILIKLLIKPTSTAFVGELSNFLCGISLIIPASLIYKKHHDKKGAVVGLVIGSFSFIFIGCIINYFLTIPFFVKLYNIDLDTIISMGSSIFPIINSKFSFVIISVSLFNATKVIITSLLTYLLYKRISPLLKGDKITNNIKN